MVQLFRLILVGFVVLTVLYVIVSIWSRETRRAKLKARWKAEGRTGDRRAWMREELEDYDQSFRRKLILLIYIVPVMVVAFLIYYVNFW
ncbi:hypothetical protein [Pseudooceanicola nanhaiensis]|uniref:hypothetical protein n=1 Tax=Pseudooceanicola nanhaiensis TaxID=375761 RepID=UPI001CD76C74|nr:hypothetical protein [Pseudooceanicola nanhaiensis]MCA0920513.1 hypothetical protein [Pseudooceanicola nanhaiensis]